MKQALNALVRLLQNNNRSWHEQILWAPYVCMSMDMQDLYIKKSNRFSSIHLIYANGITSYYSGQPRTVTSSYKYAAPKKDEKANPF